MEENHSFGARSESKQEIPALMTVGTIYLVTNENGQVYVGGDFNQEYIGVPMVSKVIEMVQNIILNLDRNLFWEIYHSNKNLMEIKTSEKKRFFIVETHEKLPVDIIGYIN